MVFKAGGVSPRFVDLSKKKKKFGRLRVVRRATNSCDDRARWLCQCECGKETVVDTHSLKSGHTTSCGCVHKEGLIKRSTKHGHAKMNSQEYTAWCNIIGRCTNENRLDFKDYGARGITISDEMRNSFKTFLDCIGSVPGPGMTVGRIENSKGYERGNIRWETRKQQTRNRRSTVWLECDGKSLPLADWSEMLNISLTTLYMRLRNGWSVERTLKTPLLRQGD